MTPQNSSQTIDWRKLCPKVTKAGNSYGANRWRWIKMKKLIFPFVEIEVPDDFPDGLDLEATFNYGLEHPEVAKRVDREYRKAYRKWLKTKGKHCAQTNVKPEKATARS
jgi:hypothetical protein